MKTTTRKQTSLRLDIFLIEALKKQAKRNHRSFNNYVEMLLWDEIERTPSAKLRKSMYEAEHDINLEKLDLKNFESFVASL